jgi:Predicted integral membrane protein
MDEKISTNSVWRGRFYRYAPLILWIGVTFINSSTVGASGNTSRFIRPLLEWLFAGASADELNLYHSYIRKFAHFAEYGVLAFWAARAFGLSARPFLQKFWHVWAFLLVALVASADEFNQSFNAQRTGSVYDVLIDTAGGLTMILFLSAFRFWRKKDRAE